MRRPPTTTGIPTDGELETFRALRTDVVRKFAGRDARKLQYLSNPVVACTLDDAFLEAWREGRAFDAKAIRTLLRELV